MADGKTVTKKNSKLSTKGSGSPLIYSTGDIEVDNVTGTSSGSQIAGMEGMNRILIYNSTLESTNNAISGSDPIKNGVILYQSTSGDADTASGNSFNNWGSSGSNGGTLSFLAKNETLAGNVYTDSISSITVTDSYSTQVSVPSSAKSTGKALSRTAFDRYYGTSTAFGTNDGEKTEAASKRLSVYR